MANKNSVRKSKARKATVVAEDLSKAKVWKSPITITPIFNEQDDDPNLAIKYGVRITISWDWFFGLFKRK